MPHTGSLIRQRRKRLGLSQHELAAASGLHVSTIHNYETGKTRPDLRRAVLLARALGIAAVSLMGDGRSEPTIVPTGGQLSDGFSWLPYVPDWDGTPVQDGHKVWPVPPTLKRGEACLVLQVGDNAMFPFLITGDIVVVDPSQTLLRSFEVVVVRVGQEVLIRMFIALKGLKIFLAPQNSFEPIVVRPDHRVLARVEAIVNRDLNGSC